MTSEHDIPKDIRQQLEDEILRRNAQRLNQELAKLARNADLILPADQRAEPQSDGSEQVQNNEYEQAPRASSYSIACERHPERNEDSHFTVDLPGRVLAGGVFDGLGGQPGSERASQLAAETVAGSFNILATDAMTPDRASQFAEDLFMGANTVIRYDKPNIATTAAFTSIYTNPETGERFASIAWAGDSRTYIIRDGQILFRTLDDGVPEHIPALDELHGNEAPEYRAQAFLESVVERPTGMLGVLFHYRNKITNCLEGDNSPIAHTADIAVQPGDIVLMTSDGIHDNLTNSEIVEIITAGGGVKELVEAALSRSRDIDHIRAKPDDMTGVLLTV